jgi:hypothetical protein
MEIAEQLQQVAAALVSFDIVEAKERVANLDHPARLRNQAPYGGADGIESEVGPAFEIENGGFALEVA